jgi:HSP20 family molecular chaperone IbpA
MKKQKSISNIRESTDGQSIVATFDMPPEVAKQDVHLSFQRNRLVIRWVTVELEEWEEDGVIMRERIEKHFNRTLPLPEGTRFEEIQATMNDHDRRLILRYPNMRCFRIDRLSRSGDS